MTLENFKDLATVVGVVLTAIAAGLALFVFRKNSMLERAKWLERLYQRFYEDDKLKAVRDLIDSKDLKDIKKVAAMVDNETSEFTDYLNFFEFVAILEKNKQLELEEVTDLFDYYLKQLIENKSVFNYVKDTNKGFEKLASLFDKLDKQ